ncbi:MAG: hypothetical protein GY720_01190 [bacterium]|nr:hypothetical protein [bacterium]
MDFSKLSANQQLTVGAAAVMFIASFFTWYGVGGHLSANGWDSGWTAVLSIVLVVAAGVVLILEAMDKATVDSPADLTFYLAAAGLAFVILRMLWRLASLDRKFGLFLALIAAGVATFAAYQNRLDNS